MAEKAEKSPLQLKDVLPQGYDSQDYFSADEIQLIASVFGSNRALLNVVRKVFLPTVHAADMPIEDFASDIFTKGIDYAQVPESEVKALVVGRQMALKYVADGLIKLKVIASFKPSKGPDPKDSAK